MKHKSEYTKNLILDEHLFMSVESTDLDGRIIKIQIVDSHGKVLLDTFVHPRWRIKKSVAECKHKITNEMTKDAPRWKDLITKIEDLTRGKMVLAYNADYVNNVMLETSRAHKVKNIEINLCCLMLRVSEYVGFWNEHFENYEYVKLIKACSLLDISYDAQNKALMCQQIALELSKRE